MRMTTRWKTSPWLALCALLACMNASAREWTLVATDSWGEHYVDLRRVKYEERYHTVRFKLLTNEFAEGPQRWTHTSIVTDYLIYCHPHPRMYYRSRIVSYKQMWAKGRPTDSFRPNGGTLNVEDGKEVEIAELMCKERRLL